MRWFWIDHFTELQRGQSAVAIKNVTLTEKAVDDHMPGFFVFPSSLIVEGMAQTGGLLVGESHSFLKRVVLAKVGKATFYEYAFPGDTLTYTITVENIQPNGAMVKGISHIGDRLQAEVEMVFAYLDDRFGVDDLFEPAKFLSMLRMLKLFDVGKKEDGTQIEVPAHMLAAEAEAEAKAST